MGDGQQKGAVMSVGYDTLEQCLLRLHSELKHISRATGLMCAADAAFRASLPYSAIPEPFMSWLCSNINERTRGFSAANMAPDIRDESDMCYAVKGKVP